MILFRYELAGVGWADAYLSDGAAFVEIPASYLCDALRDLVDAIESLFATSSAECIWLEEPGEAKWFFTRNGDLVEVRVEWWNAARTHPDRDEWEPVLDKVMFSGEAKFLDFAKQLDQALQRLLDKWGLEGYLREWIESVPGRISSAASTSHRSLPNLKSDSIYRHSSGHREKVAGSWC